MNKIKSYLNLFWQLLKTDFVIFNKSIVSGIIDTSIWISILLAIFTYIFPHLGMTKNFSSIVLVGAIVSCGLFETFSFAATFLADIEGNKTISYFFTLPIPSWLIFVKSALAQAYKTIILSLIIIPLGKLILWQRLDLSNISIYKFLLIFLSINVFLGMFAVFLSSIPKDMSQIRSIWIRILFPLWFLGGAEFPLRVVQKMSPRLAYLFFLNPVTYAMEGIRAATLGQHGYLNIWICLGAIWFFGIIFGFLGIKRLKKRLDFV